MNSDEQDIDFEVESIIDQIKSQSKNLKKVEKTHPTLEKKDLEKFVIDNASTVVTDSVEMIQALKDEVMIGAEPRTIEAISELVKAVTGAIDSLSKLKLSDDKIQSQKEIKEMDIKSKQLEYNTPQNVLTFSREEVLKRMLSLKNENPPTIVDI